MGPGDSSDDKSVSGDTPPVIGEVSRTQPKILYVPGGRSLWNCLDRIPQLKRATWLVLICLAVLVIIGGLLFWCVAARSDAACAYDLLTQHKSPMDTDDPYCGLHLLGAAGVLLGSFGFFAAPAVIGAVVGGVYTALSQMTDERIDETTTDIGEG